MPRYEIHSATECAGDPAVEVAVNKAHQSFSDSIGGGVDSKADRRYRADGPQKPTGWRDCGDDATQTYHWRRASP